MGLLPTAVVALGFGVFLGALFGVLISARQLHQAHTIAFCLVVGVSAVGGHFASGKPTEVPQADTVLRCLVAGVFVVVMSRCRPRIGLLVGWVFAAISIYAMFSGSGRPSLASVAFAFGAAGVATASHVFPKQSTLLRIFVGGALSQSALRLPTNLPPRLPSIVAALALAALVLSALTRRSANKQRSAASRAVAVGVGIFAVTATVCAVVGGVALLRARTHAELGLRSARAGVAAASDGDTTSAVTEFDRSQKAIDLAQRSIDSGPAKLGLLVPILAQNMSEISGLLNTAHSVVASAQSATVLSRPGDLRDNTGRFDLKKFEVTGSELGEARLVLLHARSDLAQSPSPWLLPQVKFRLNSILPDIESAIEATERIEGALTRLPGFLGGEGPRRYLLVVPTPAETRGSGGVIGNFGEIVADNGSLTLTRFGRSLDLTGNGLALEDRVLNAPEDYKARYVRFGAPGIWSNLTMSPDFPTTATVLADQYTQSGGSPVDGVMSVDPIALQALLSVLGPVSVPSWPQPLTADNAAKVLLHDAYVTIGGASAERLALLEELALTVWADLTQTQVPSPSKLARSLGPVIRNRHLQVWMRNAAEQHYISDLNLSGSVPELRGDSFGVIVNNASQSKIDYFLTRDTQIDVSINPATGDVTSTATLLFTNGAPASGESAYILGDGSFTPIGSSRLFVSVYSPYVMTSSKRQDGTELKVTNEVELGRNVFSFYLETPSQTSTSVTLTFAGKMVDPRTYVLDLFTQPLVNRDNVRVSISTTDQSDLVGTSLLTGQGHDLSINFQPSSTATLSARRVP